MTTTTTQNYAILDQIAEYMDYCKSLRLENLEGRKISYIGKGGKYRKTYNSTEAYDKLLEWISYAGVTDWL